ncbi:MAG: TetR/AcrR family transcriptional regulator [Eubacteriales bacterium]|nr:TetR/AcrR family transcriptional regulator [Eubacteriales bacterium]
MAGDRATKMLILSSARTLFSEKGYDETPVEEICALAGVAKGTFFYHFESKQYIVRYIMAMQLKEFGDKLKEQMDTLKDAISKVEYYFSALIESNRGNEAQSYFKDREAEWFKTVMNEERMNALYPLLEEVVYEGISEGFFRVKNPGACAAIAFLGIDAFIHRNVPDGDDAKKGIQEMTAKMLGIRESAFAM